MVGRLQESLKLRALTLRDHLDRPVRQVANPAVEAQRPGAVDEEVPKTHALHVATNYSVQALHVSRLEF
jgi:hypothetical protein